MPRKQLSRKEGYFFFSIFKAPQKIILTLYVIASKETIPNGVSQQYSNGQCIPENHWQNMI